MSGVEQLDIARSAAFEADAALRYRGFRASEIGQQREQRRQWYMQGDFDNGEAVHAALIALATASQPDKRVEDMRERCAQVADDAWASAAASVGAGGGLMARGRAATADDIRVAIRALPTTSNERDSRHGD